MSEVEFKQPSLFHLKEKNLTAIALEQTANTEGDSRDAFTALVLQKLTCDSWAMGIIISTENLIPNMGTDEFKRVKNGTLSLI